MLSDVLSPVGKGIGTESMDFTALPIPLILCSVGVGMGAKPMPLAVLKSPYMRLPITVRMGALTISDPILPIPNVLLSSGMCPGTLTMWHTAGYFPKIFPAVIGNRFPTSRSGENQTSQQNKDAVHCQHPTSTVKVSDTRP